MNASGRGEPETGHRGDSLEIGVGRQEWDFFPMATETMSRSLVLRDLHQEVMPQEVGTRLPASTASAMIA